MIDDLTEEKITRYLFSRIDIYPRNLQNYLI